jgi:hypothetical protein
MFDTSLRKLRGRARSVDFNATDSGEGAKVPALMVVMVSSRAGWETAPNLVVLLAAMSPTRYAMGGGGRDVIGGNCSGPAPPPKMWPSTWDAIVSRSPMTSRGRRSVTIVPTIAPPKMIAQSFRPQGSGHGVIFREWFGASFELERAVPG